MVLVIFLLLLSKILTKGSSVAASILIITYLLYELLVVDLSKPNYYSATAALNFIAGCVMYSVSVRVAICSYSLVACNSIGYILWVTYSSPSLYNSMSFSILTVQILMLLPKGLINGFGNNIKRFVFGGIIAFSFKASARYGESLQRKKAIK